MSDFLQTILDRRAAATPGPAFAEVIDDHGRGGKSWLVTDVVRTRWGNNALSFDEDEGTARFVAASFTDVPALAGRLQRVEQIIEDMQHLIDRDDVTSDDFARVAADLRKLLSGDTP